jgi:hypothetical protein
MHIFTGDFYFKGLTARRFYKSFGVKVLMIRTLLYHQCEVATNKLENWP